MELSNRLSPCQESVSVSIERRWPGMAGLHDGNSARTLHAMPKPKRKLTAKQREAKRRRRAEFMTIFVNGKQKRVRRPPTIGGMEVDEFVRSAHRWAKSARG